MVKISDKDRELLGKLDCEEDFWFFLEVQFMQEVTTNPRSDPTYWAKSYWAKRAGYISARLRGLLAAIRAHEETE